MDPNASLYTMTRLIFEHPWALVLVAGLGPIVLGLLVERVGREPAPGADTAPASNEPELAAAAPASSEPDLAAAAPASETVEPVAAPPIDSAAAPEPEPAPSVARQDAAPAEVEPEPPTQPDAQLPAQRPKVRLRDRLLRTSEALVGRLGGLLGGRTLDAALLEELEEVLFTADLGVQTAQSLLETVRREASGADGDRVRAVLKEAIREKLAAAAGGDPDRFALQGRPHVILVLGVNGAGKTTTIGKLAAQHQAKGRRVLLGAGDTFRAAAIEQLQTWGERVGCEVIAGVPGGDPASVAFDAVKGALRGEADVAIIDTAGRLQTKKPLMEELGKIVRVLGKDLPEAPHEVLLVLDANTGQNAISQARLFTEVADVTGLVLTKMDGTAKGGVIVGLADEFGIPVRFVGVGEGIEDLRPFDVDEFVEALFDEG